MFVTCAAKDAAWRMDGQGPPDVGRMEDSGWRQQNEDGRRRAQAHVAGYKRRQVGCRTHSAPASPPSHILPARLNAILISQW